MNRSRGFVYLLLLLSVAVCCLGAFVQREQQREHEEKVLDLRRDLGEEKALSRTQSERSLAAEAAHTQDKQAFWESVAPVTELEPIPGDSQAYTVLVNYQTEEMSFRDCLRRQADEDRYASHRRLTVEQVYRRCSGPSEDGEYHAPGSRVVEDAWRMAQAEQRKAYVESLMAHRDSLAMAVESSACQSVEACLALRQQQLDDIISTTLAPYSPAQDDAPLPVPAP